MFDDPDVVPRDMLDSMEEDYYSERKRADAAEAEVARLRKALGEIAARCLAMPQVLENYTTRRVLRIARAALDAEDTERNDDE